MRGPRWYDLVDWRLVWVPVVLVVGVIAVFGYQAVQVRDDLDEAATHAEVLRDQLVDGDSAGATETLARLQGVAQSAHDRSDGPLWRVGATIPWLGRNVDAASVVAAEVDRIADEAAPPMVDLAGQVNARTFSPSDGTLDLAALARVSSAVSRSHAALADARRSLDGLDADSLLGPVRGPVRDLTAQVGSVEQAAGNADLAARLLPDLLGDGGPRRYLLLNQNNAESRPAGGIVGSFAVVTARGGRITLGLQGSIQDLPPLDEPVLPLTSDERAAFPSSIGTDIRDVTITPDFPRTAELARALVEKRFDVSLDGVLSVDPVAVSHLLAGTGPVELDSGQVLDEDNAVSTLLHDVYTDIDDVEAQDEFFEEANDRIFDAFVEGAGDPSALLRAIVRGVEENRIAFWSARASEQDLVAATALSGVFPADDGPTPHVGIYLSDAASTKMEYYLRQESDVTALRCREDGSQELRTTTTLRSDAPVGAASLPTSVTGSGRFVTRGLMSLNVRIFAPVGGAVTSIEVDGAETNLSDSSFEGRGLARVDFTVRPGQTRTITTTMVTGPGQRADPQLATTPGIEPAPNDVSVPSACG